MNDELDRIRAGGGVAIDDQEHALGVVAVGGVVRGTSGPVVAISVPFPVERKHELQSLVSAVRTTCEEATTMLGDRSPQAIA